MADSPHADPTPALSPHVPPHPEEAARALTTKEDPRHLWTFAVNGSLGAVPMLLGNTLYVGADDKKLYAVDLETGNKKWEFSTRNWVRSGVCLGNEGQLYVGSDDCNLYALNQETGARLWAAPLNGSIRNTPTLGPDGTVYVANHNHEFRERGVATSIARVFAVDGQTGHVRWQSRALEGSIESEASPVLGPKNTLLYPAENRLIALDRDSGEERWSVDLKGRGGTPLVGPDGSVYTSTEGWKNQDVHRVLCIDPDKGEVRWEFNPKSIGSCIPALSLSQDGALYVGDWGRSVYSLDASTGHQRWEVQPGDYGAFRPTAGPDGRVYFAGGRDNKLYALDGATGETLWSFRSSGELWRTPSLTPGGVLVGNRDGQLHAVATDLESRLSAPKIAPGVKEGDGFVLVGGVALRRRAGSLAPAWGSESTGTGS